MTKKLLLILALVLSLQCSSEAKQIKLEDIKRLENRSEQVRAKSYRTLIKQVKAKKEIIYTEAFLLGHVFRRLKDYKSAIQWFARACYYQRDNLPKSYGSKDVSEYLEQGGKHSALRAEALYFAAQSYFDMSHTSDPRLMLAKIEKAAEPLQEKIMLLEAEITNKESDEKKSIAAYDKLVSKFSNVTYYLRLGHLNQKVEDDKRALAAYLKILEHPAIDWSYMSSSRKIRAILNQNKWSTAMFSDEEKVRYAEGLRMTGHPNDSLALWRGIKFEKLNSQIKYYYLQNYLRSLVTNSRYSEATGLFKRLKSKFSKEERLKIFEDFVRRLFYKARYKEMVALIPVNFADSDIAYYRLNALSRLGDTRTETEALQYLREHNTRKRYVEHMVFQRCLKPLLAKQLSTAQDCLMRLRYATQDTEFGGRSRYYLARIWQKQGKTKKAESMYKEVYLNSPASSYAIKSLDNLRAAGGNPPSGNLQTIRSWLAENASSDKQLAAFFANKAANDNYAVDRFWVTWQKKLDDLEKKLKQNELKAAIFIAIGDSRLANDYLRDDEKYKGFSYVNEQDALLRQKVAIETNDSHLKYYNMKRYLRIHHHQPDIFLLNNLAAECLYPTPYIQEVNRQARANGVEVAGIYALMRQESQYHTGATSRSNAKGLMQLLPSTAQWLNRSMRVPGLNLYNPRHNIKLGTKFFSDLNRQFNNDFDKSAAAYNGGPGRVGRWLRSIKFEELELFFEQIPYQETYYYQKITRANYDRYRILIEHKQLDIKSGS